MSVLEIHTLFGLEEGPLREPSLQTTASICSVEVLHRLQHLKPQDAVLFSSPSKPLQLLIQGVILNTSTQFLGSLKLC